MGLGRSVAGLDEVVAALARGDGVEDVADGVADGVPGSGGGLAEPVLELGKELLDRVQVGRVFGRKKSRAPAARMAWRTALLLCEPRLSMTTMSPGRSVGTRTCST